MQSKQLIWDIPTRVFHWLIVLCFAIAYITSGNDEWELLHITCGYSLFGLMLFRLLWGFVGSRHARFASFVKKPAAAIQYLKSLQGKSASPEHHSGHNPAGAWAIVLLIALGLLTPIAGYITFNNWLGDWIADVHGALGNIMLGLVVIHLLGVIVGSLKHRENIVRAMFSGYKSASAGEGITKSYAWLGGVMLVAVAGFWAYMLLG